MNHCVPVFMFTSYCTALPIGPRIQAATACCMKRRKAAVGSTERVTFTIPAARVQKSRRSRKSFPRDMQNCWSGIANGVRRPVEILQRRIRFYKRADPAGIFEPMNMRTNMSIGCETAGNEPHLLGHKSIHLSFRGLRKIFDSGHGPEEPDAGARRSAHDLGDHARRDFGEADSKW